MLFRSTKEKWAADVFLECSLQVGDNFYKPRGSETSLTAHRHGKSKQSIYQQLNYLSISLSKSI